MPVIGTPSREARTMPKLSPRLPGSTADLHVHAVHRACTSTLSYVYVCTLKRTRTHARAVAPIACCPDPRRCACRGLAVRGRGYRGWGVHGPLRVGRIPHVYTEPPGTLSSSSHVTSRTCQRDTVTHFLPCRLRCLNALRGRPARRPESRPRAHVPPAGSVVGYG